MASGPSSDSSESFVTSLKAFWGNLGLTSSTLVVFSAFWVYCYLVVWTAFRRGAYGFADLGLINDILSNTAYGRGFFWVSEYGMHHFGVYFSPTMVLFLPFFRLFHSQFLLLALGITTTGIAMLLYLGIFREVARRLSLEKELSSLFLVVFLILILTNRFTKTVLLSDHYENQYLFFWALVAYGLLRGWRFAWLLLLAFLPLGIRQDAGFFFGFQMLALAALPIWNRDVRGRNRALALAALGLTYTAGVSLFVMPHWGGDAHVVLWAKYGNTWSAVVRTWVLSPGLVLQDIRHSALAALNFSFLLLPLSAPFSWLLANLPGVLFYTASDTAKKYLWYYNASFLLPGLFLLTGVGWLRVLGFCRRRKGHRWNTTLPHALAFGAIAIQAIVLADTNNQGRFRVFFDIDNSSGFSTSLNRVLAVCHPVHAIATDYVNYVFLPNQYEKYMLDNYDRADLLVIPPPKPLSSILLGFSSLSEAQEKFMKDPRWKLVLQQDQTSVFARREIECGPAI